MATSKQTHQKRGLYHLLRGVEANADLAKDSGRIGRKTTGMKVGVKKVKFVGKGIASGKAMGQAAKERRGGFSMSGMGESPEKKKQRAAKIAKHGTLIERVAKANFSRKVRPYTEAHSDRYHKRMAEVKAKIKTKKAIASGKLKIVKPSSSGIKRLRSHTKKH